MLSNKDQINIVNAIRKDPVWGVQELFQCEYGLWEKQKEIVRSVLIGKNRITAVRSCHDSGKSFIAARVALIYLSINKNSLVITTAPSWTQVKEILWREIRSAYVKMETKYPTMGVGGKLLTTSLEFNPTWYAMGIATKKESEVTEVAERMLGFHSVTGKILVIVDEGSGVMEPIWGSIDGLLTSDKAQLLAIGNPYRKVGPFAKLFTTPGVKKVHIQDTDIPNIKQNKIIVPGLMSPKYPKEMAEKYGKDSNLYAIKVKGNFPKSETDTLISLDYVEGAFLRDLKPTGEKLLGVDVARFGNDFTALVVRQGKKVLRKETHAKEDTMQTASRVLRMIEEEGIKPQNVFIDVIGIGAGVVDRLHEKEYNERGFARNYNVNGVSVSESAEDSDHFKNLRAEAYWQIRDWIKTADLPEDDDFLQLANIKYKYSSGKKGQLLIESKEDMKKRGLQSPDVADALMLTFTDVQIARLPVQRENEEDDVGRPLTRGLMQREF